MPDSPQWSAVQGAAVMILLRLFAFFCCGAPYSAAHAKGMFLAALLQAAMVLPMLHFRHRLQIAPAVRRLLRLYALLYGALLIASLFTLSQRLLPEQSTAVMLLLVPTLLYTTTLHDRATARTATLLLCTAALGFLLLPISGIGTARRILLYTPDSAAAAFLREWQLSGELPLLPLIRKKQTAPAAQRSTAAWVLFRCIFLPGLVLFGAMQNGRLLRFAGNPFFLLLARTPLSDAVRTDGFWLLLAFACGVLCITFCLQTGKPHSGTSFREMGAAILPCLFFLAGWLLFPQLRAYFGIAAALLGIVLPWGIIIFRRTDDPVRKGEPL